MWNNKCIRQDIVAVAVCCWGLHLGDRFWGERTVTSQNVEAEPTLCKVGSLYRAYFQTTCALDVTNTRHRTKEVSWRWVSCPPRVARFINKRIQSDGVGLVVFLLLLFALEPLTVWWLVRVEERCITFRSAGFRACILGQIHAGDGRHGSSPLFGVGQGRVWFSGHASQEPVHWKHCSGSFHKYSGTAYPVDKNHIVNSENVNWDILIREI